MIFAVFIPALIAMISYFLFFICCHDAAENTIPPGDDGHDDFKPNYIDVKSLHQMRTLRRYRLFRLFMKTPRQQKTFTKWLTKFMLANFDVGLIGTTGLWIAAFSQFCSADPLRAYHWHIVVHLTQLSTIANLPCLSLLRGEFARSPLWRRALRLFFLSFLVILFVFGQFTTRHLDWDADMMLYGDLCIALDDKTLRTTAATPAICAIRDTFRSAAPPHRDVIGVGLCLYVLRTLICRSARLFKATNVIYLRIRTKTCHRTSHFTDVFTSIMSELLIAAILIEWVLFKTMDTIETCPSPPPPWSYGAELTMCGLLARLLSQIEFETVHEAHDGREGAAEEVEMH
jgi:hypothetical protein